MTSPEDGWLDGLGDLDLDTPPERIDQAIAHLARRGGDPDGKQLFLVASLRLIRHIQATFTPGRFAAPDDLDQAVRAGERALAWLRRAEEPSVESESMVLQVVAEALQLRDAPGDTDRAIEVMAEAVRRFPRDSPAWVMAVSGLGDRHYARYTKDHRADDFTATEWALRTAFDAGWPERANLWMRLGALYEERFRAQDDVRDHRQALETFRAGWAEDPASPLLALAYADAAVNSGVPTSPEELDELIEELATVEVGALPAMLQPQFHYLVTMAHFRRFGERHDPADLPATVAAAGRLIGHPHAEPDLAAEARWIRASVQLDHASSTGVHTVDVDALAADLTAAFPLLRGDQRRVADAQITRVLAERSRLTGRERDAAAATDWATQALQRLPDGTAEKAEVRYHLAFQLMAQSSGRAVALFRQVAADPAASAKVRAAAGGQLATAVAATVYYLGGDPSELDAAIVLARDTLRATGLDDINRAAFAAALAGALLVRYEMRGDLSDLRWSLDLLQDLRDERPYDPHRDELLLALAQAQLMWSEAVGEPPPAETFVLLEGVAAAAPPGDPRRVQALRSLAGGSAMRAGYSKDAGDWRRAVRYARELLAAVPPQAAFTGLMRLSAGGTLLLAGRELDDLGLLREGADLLAATSDDPASRLLRGRYLALYGLALLTLHQRAPQPGDLDRALAVLREADAAATAEPGQRGAAEIAMGRSAALALSGDPAGAAAAGRAGMRARAWQVLLQSGTHDAMTTARRSAADALNVARAALKAGDRPGAWLALETGRGLVLHAATVAATVPGLLRAAGETGLAGQWNAGPADTDAAGWRTATPAMPSDARYRALGVLEREATLFDPPPAEAVGDALTAVGADALVYLFPGAGGEAGFALLVEPGGRIGALDLPGLTGDWSDPETLQRAIGARDLGPVPDDPRTERTLADVCRDAWHVAIGPLLDHWRSGHHGEPHLVLVPDGALAAVPWHAAHSGDRWAIDEAAFSYIASARLLVDVARRSAPPPGAVGLVIGNPDTGDPAGALPGAGVEATTIFRRHYAAGRYCGRPGPAVLADGPGRPQDVYDWLTATGTPPATVLHLACHGVIRADGPASSYLLLAHGARVSAEDLLRAAADRPAARSPGLVSLAACTTHRAGRAYDEAVTLSTAFLVAGASTAIGSLWPVPDRATARLMVAFHDNLAAPGRPPHAALRSAQRAMRDDGATLVDWAGFVHLGR
ncbi:CHAT domain-containing protein [Actinoplanes sp. NPDC049596]|uniref:CHAT domain-containing protein n=1 Tax=unclassified Actinoplanes TaxID=2626549 RepID=UPI00342A3F06